MELMCLNLLTKTVPLLCNKALLFHLRSKSSSQLERVICRVKGRLLCRRCRPHGGRRYGTMGRLWRVKLSAGIRMMVLLTLSKWHPGERGRRRTPRHASLLSDACSGPLFAFISIQGPSLFDLRPSCRLKLLNSTPDSLLTFEPSKISIFYAFSCWLSNSGRILFCRWTECKMCTAVYSGA